MTSKPVSLDLPRDISETGAMRDRFLIRLEESELEQQLNISQNRYALHPDQELKTEIQNIEESLKTLREKK